VQFGDKMKKIICNISKYRCILFISILLAIPSIYGISTSVSEQLTNSIEKNSVVDFELVITDIQGDKVVIETSLEKDGNNEIITADSSNPMTYENNKKRLIIKGPFSNSLKIKIHGKIPNGVKYRDISLANGKVLKIVEFDKDNHPYYIIKDMKNDETLGTNSETYVITYPELEELDTSLTKINDENVKKIADKFIEHGLYAYVKDDMIPLFKKYNFSAIRDVEALNENISMLKNENKKLKGDANLWKYISVALFVLLIVGSIGMYKLGERKGSEDGYKKGYKAGNSEGYERGYDDGISGRNKDINL
jgi:hypothetical protein